jgi:2-methylcitrate dehydratase PrpD
MDHAQAALALSIASDMGTGLLAQAPRQHVVLRTPLGGSLGLYAAGLAAEGIEGRLDVLPAFCEIYGRYEPSLLLDGLGERFIFGECGFLPKLFHFSTGIYPTLHGIQAHRRNATYLSQNIVGIECLSSPALRQVYGAAPDLSREMTHFSLKLAIALALTGSGFLYEDVATLPHPDPEVRRLSALVELTAHPDLHEHVNLSAAAEQTVTELRLRDGGVIRIDSVPYPAVTDPARDEGRVKALFMRRLGPRWGDSRAQAIIEAVEGLDQDSGLEKLLHALSPPPSDTKGAAS